MDQIDELLTRRVDKIYPSKEALEKVLRSGKKLRLYQGFDPSSPNLHIGHLVGLLKLKEFQSLGHEVIFLIGDFTGMIGDPTGKLQARKILTKKQVLANAKTYQTQAGKILHFSGPNPVKLKFNSQWNEKLNFLEALKLASFLTYRQVIKREMFAKRLKTDTDIYINEFLYPLIQGYDSVALNVDLEIGGSDQMFNMLVGRDLMHKVKNKEKFVMTTKLLVDSQGNKIGKTEGNAINLTNSPAFLFGQIMSLPDEAIISCFELITNLSMLEIKRINHLIKIGRNPMIFKKKLAFTIVKMLNNEQKAQTAQVEFEKVHQDRGVPSKVKSLKLKVKSWNIIDLLIFCKLASSKSQAKRLIKQGAVKINHQPLTINHQSLSIKTGDILSVGKLRWIKLI